MKISEMNNEQATEAMIRIATPFSNLCNDQEMIDTLDEIGSLDKGTSMITVVGKYLPKVIMCAFRTHKDDLYEIISAISLKPVSAVAKMKFTDTIQLLRDSYDDIMKNFFTSSAAARKKSADE